MIMIFNHKIKHQKMNKNSLKISKNFIIIKKININKNGKKI